MAQPRRKTKPQAGDDKTNDLAGVRLLVVEARFYDDIADMLLMGATAVLTETGVDFDRISVPGALEIPTAIEIALAAAEQRKAPYDGVVALGCVIQGETGHYDIVANESARCLMDISVSRRLPAGNGILTTDTRDQAIARARPDRWDKGGGAVKAALALIRLKRSEAAKKAPAAKARGRK
jgi:6,7-dimethyl-8-ribityllumazine synthase